MEIIGYVLHCSLSWCLCLKMQECRAGSCAAPSPHREVPWLDGSVGGPGLISAPLQSCREAVTPAQPSCHESCFSCAQETPRAGAAVLIPFVMWLSSPPPPHFPGTRHVHGSHGWSSAGRLNTTCPGTHGTASRLVLPSPCCLV